MGMTPDDHDDDDDHDTVPLCDKMSLTVTNHQRHYTETPQLLLGLCPLASTYNIYHEKLI